VDLSSLTVTRTWNDNSNAGGWRRQGNGATPLSYPNAGGWRQHSYFRGKKLEVGWGCALCWSITSRPSQGASLHRHITISLPFMYLAVRSSWWPDVVSLIVIVRFFLRQGSARTASVLLTCVGLCFWNSSSSRDQNGHHCIILQTFVDMSLIIVRFFREGFARSVLVLLACVGLCFWHETAILFGVALLLFLIFWHKVHSTSSSTNHCRQLQAEILCEDRRSELWW